MKKLLALVLALALTLALGTAAFAESTEGQVLNIWCWNDEFQSRFNDY